jgi:hypothetical protein
MMIDTLNGGEEMAFGGPHNYVFVRAQTCKVDFGERCSGFQEDVENAPDNFIECGANAPFPNYILSSGGSPRPASGEGRVGMFVVELEMAPDPAATLGAALGYVGFLELLATIIFTFVLSKLGCLSGGDASYMSLWIKDLVGQQDTAKQLGQEVGGAWSEGA